MEEGIDSPALVERAKAILEANDLGSSTKPAPDLYPHQWNWDSCFIAIGLSRYNTERAAREILSLLEGQWRNGMVPQIVFNPHASGYFPGADVWQSDRSPDAPRNVQTSGITQPPVLASAALSVWENAEDKGRGRAFLAEVYPRLLRYHRWLYEERDPDSTGLVAVVHPWESGLDNSPPYLDAGSRVTLSYKPRYERLDLLHVAAANRPTNKDYDLFVYLLEQMRAVNWDQRAYLETAPLQVEDVLFNSVLCKANRDLAAIAEVVGEDGGIAREWQERTADAINAKLWDEEAGMYYSFDRVAGQPLKIDTVAAFHTLYGGVATDERGRRVISTHLLDTNQFWPSGGFPVPTTSMASPWFNRQNYWLGPVWVNTNWMISHGLQGYGRADLARSMRGKTLELIQRSGFREYFDPMTGEGHGTDSFSWSAALTIDLLADPGRDSHAEAAAVNSITA